MNRPSLSILLVEDNPGDAVLLREALLDAGPERFQLNHVKCLADGLRILAGGGVDVVLLDLSLPDEHGLKTVTRARLAAPGVPIVVLTGLDDEEFAIKAVREGAEDYLVKGQIDGRLLVRCLRYAIERHRLLGERKRAEEALIASQEYALNIINSSLDMIIAVDNDRRIIEFNPAAQKAFGWSLAEVYQRNIGILYARGEEGEEIHRETMAGGSCIREVRNIRKNGEVFSSLLSACSLRNARGEALGFMGISRDITERKNLEEQLRQSQKMESVGKLAGGVAHDFNNMLTVIQGNAAMLGSQQALNPQQAESIQLIAQAAERAANLTRQLLTFSRQQVIQLKNHNLNEIVTQMTGMLQRILGEDMTLEVRFFPSLPAVHADRGLMEQVLMNLVVNSRDAMPKGGRLVIATGTSWINEAYLRQNPEAVPGPCVSLSVSDTGCGIKPEDLPHIFEPFFTTKEVGKGTGLGLATVYGIVKQHKGWLEVRSEVGRGTTFTVLLPATESRVEKEAPAAVDSGSHRGSETILVVEDEDLVRGLVRTILEQYGYSVLEAPTGVAAIGVWERHASSIDLVLTDLVMPGGINGYELAEKLQARRPGLKVVYTSGYSPDMSSSHFKLSNGRNFLPKPFRPHTLAQMIRDCLDDKLETGKV
jgi:PAS domain S-box-containing protein